MRKPISTATHGVLDYVTIGTFLALPRLLGCSRRFTGAVTCVALGKLAYTLFTRHELGLVKVIPMKAHLAMDAAGGATLAALPFLTDEQDRPAAAAFVALGLFDIAAAPLTQTHPAQTHPTSSGTRAAAAGGVQWAEAAQDGLRQIVNSTAAVGQRAPGAAASQHQFQTMGR